MNTCNTYQDLFDEINGDINQDRATAMFGEDKKYFIKKVQGALNKVYRYFNWNWTIENNIELLPVISSDNKKFVVPKNPMGFISIHGFKSGDSQQSSCGCGTTSCPGGQKITLVRGIDISSIDDVAYFDDSNGMLITKCSYEKLVINYRRTPEMPDIGCSCNCQCGDQCDCETSEEVNCECCNLCDYKVDVPFMFFDIVKDLILSDMFHLWMGEGVGNYMKFFYERAYKELERQAKNEEAVSGVKQSLVPQK